jgi:hypothetical protein
MKKILVSLLSITLFCSCATLTFAGEAKTYQVTGPVLEVGDKFIVVQKGDDKWQIAADKSLISKVKTGDKVTIKYQMVATDVEAKSGKADKK